MQSSSITSLPIASQGEQISAALEVPSSVSNNQAAVLLLGPIAGVNDYLRGVSSRLAQHGYTVLLLDYYSREGAALDVSTPEKIGAAVAALSDRRVLGDAGAAFSALRQVRTVDSNRIGVLGFCIGGMYAFLSACEEKAPRAAVSYYGTVRYSKTSTEKPHSPLDRVPALQTPLLAHFGTHDRLISATDLDEFEHALQANGKHYELYRYRGAPHAFDEDFRAPVFRPVAARLAWHRTLTFLDWHLRGIAPR